jgi:hypothetical protein
MPGLRSVRRRWLRARRSLGISADSSRPSSSAAKRDRSGAGKGGEIEDGLAALREVRLAIDELDAIAGRLARETVNRGGSWDDIGAALKLRTDAAQNAYRRPR